MRFKDGLGRLRSLRVPFAHGNSYSPCTIFRAFDESFDENFCGVRFLLIESPDQPPSHVEHSPRIFLSAFSFQADGSLTCLLRLLGCTQPMFQKGLMVRAASRDGRSRSAISKHWHTTLEELSVLNTVARNNNTQAAENCALSTT